MTNRLLTLGGLALEGRVGVGVANARSRLAILAVLAAAGSAGIRRDKLAAMFWPESDEERSRNALRQSLFALRRDLGEDDLTTGTLELRLNRLALESDVAEFEEAIAAGHHEVAVSLYRGPFLDSVYVRDAAGFERWAEDERRRLASLYAQALETLARQARAQGDMNNAVRWWRLRAQHEPLSARVARSLMEALVEADDREAAIQHADVHARLTRAELDAEPDATLVALANKLRTATMKRVEHASESATSTGVATTAMEPVSQVPAATTDGNVVALSLRKPRLANWLALAAAAVLAIAVGVWRNQSDKDNAAGGAVRFALSFPPDAPLANGSGAPFAISPDGRLIAYRAQNGSRVRLHVRSLDRLDAVTLAGTEDAEQPTFSPDGLWIAFMARDRLLKVPTNGGAATTLAVLTNVQGVSWGAAGMIVVASGDSLLEVAESGGVVRALANPDTARGERGQRWPLALPDGKTVLYTSWRGPLLAARIGVARRIAPQMRARARPRTRPRTRSLDLDGMHALSFVDGHLFFASATNELFAVSFNAREGAPYGIPVRVASDIAVGAAGGLKAALSHSGTLAFLSEPWTNVVAVDSSGVSRVVLRTRGRYEHPRLAPDGRQVAVAVGAGVSRDIWLFDLVTGVPQRLTTGGQSDAPEWTPDGSRVLFHYEHGTRSELWWRIADGSAPSERLTDSTQDAREGILTPDGRRLVYRAVDRKTGDDLWIATLDPVGGAVPLVATSASERLPRLSPDGRLLAYESNESGTYEVYVRPMTGDGARVKVSARGGRHPLWSRDGRQLYYGSDGQLIAASVSARQPLVVTGHRVMLDAGFILSSGGHQNYDVMPGGRQFLFPAPRGADSLIIVRGWSGEIRGLIADKTPSR